MKQIFNLFFFLLCSFSTNALSNYSDTLSLERYLRANNIETKRTPEGLHYKLIKKGNNATPKIGDYVKVRYSVMTLDSILLDQTVADDPYVFQLGYSYEFSGLDKGIVLLNKGGSAKLYIPAKLGYKRGKDAQPLMVEVELLDIMSFKEYDNYMRDLEAKERTAFEAGLKNNFRKDLKLIRKYNSEKKLNTLETSSGLNYAITQKGRGKNARPGDFIKVMYEGYLLDGMPFEKSPSGEPFEFQLGRSKVIEGWEEGLQFFNKGSEGWLILPSKLGYGPMSIEEEGISIPAFSVLVFKIKMLDIRRP